jgi:hypothetical protein
MQGIELNSLEVSTNCVGCEYTKAEGEETESMIMKPMKILKDILC